uniref:Uncharacterized protein n=1 Tax=Fusarium oxysporum (strain Fo5176) TaxID=660025 RepID=A0A0D2Y5T9_FUSOF
MELIDALKSYTDPANDGIKSKKDALRVYDRVKDVCSPLITMEDTNGSQKISLCHKSVKDFFIDPKNKRRIEEYLPDFFIDENKALEELGVRVILQQCFPSLRRRLLASAYARHNAKL